MSRSVISRALAAGAALALCVPGAATAQELAFVSERDGNAEIYVMNADGSAQRNVTNDGADDRDPVWSPDGARIAFVRGFGSDADVWDMAADGSGARRLAAAEGPDRSPSWSPDGRRIAFVSDRAGVPEIHVMNADGSGVVQLTRTGGVAAAPAWSPDGRSIAYWREDDARVHVMAADGTSDRALGDGVAADRDPAWSPDGGRLAFVTLRDPALDLDVWRMGADGSGPVALASSTGRDIDPAWSSDDRIAFASDRDGNLEIWVMAAADGSGARRLTDAPGDDSAPTWRPPAVFLTPLPAPGAPAGPAPGGPSSRPGATVTAGGIRITLLRSRVELRRGRLIVTLRFRLGAAASGTYQVHHRGRVVARRTHRGRRGINTLRITRRVADRARWVGRYRLSVVNLRRRPAAPDVAGA